MFLVIFLFGLMLGYTSYPVIKKQATLPIVQKDIPDWDKEIYSVPFISEFNSQANWKIFKISKWYGTTSLVYSSTLTEVRIFTVNQTKEIEKLLNDKSCTCYEKFVKGKKIEFEFPKGDQIMYMAVLFTNVGKNEFGIKF